MVGKLEANSSRDNGWEFRIQVVKKMGHSMIGYCVDTTPVYEWQQQAPKQYY